VSRLGHLSTQAALYAAAVCVLAAAGFALLRVLPGDPLDAYLASDIAATLPDAAREDLRQRLGLGGTAAAQFLAYLRLLAAGQWGHSLTHAAPVRTLIATSLPWTLGLVLLALPVALLLGAGAGLYAGSRPGGRGDAAVSTVATVLSSIPAFVVSLLLLGAFAIALEWLPLSGGASLFSGKQGWDAALDRLRHAALPAAALALHGFIQFFYLARGLAVRIGSRPYVEAARARGIGGARLLWHYYARNALPGLLGRLSAVLPGMLGATLFVEIVFAYPGVGKLMVDAIHARDLPLVQGIVLANGLLVLALNMLLDAVGGALARRG